MYHTSINTQVFSKKQFLFHPDFIYDFTQIVTDNYVKTLTPLSREVFIFIDRFKNSPYIKLTNQFIAERIGCSVKTVTRATNQFHKDGFILKHQQNRYAPNYFSLNVPQNKNSSLIDIYIKNLTLRTRTRVRKRFKKNKKEGVVMTNFDKQFPNMAKTQQKRKNDGGHSPAVVKPVMSVEDQIHSKKVDIAFFKQQLEKPETFWDPRSILFSANITMVKSLLARAQFQLDELENSNPLGSNNEKQSVSNQYSPSHMVTGSA